jgi:hypothetical protein
MIPNLSMLVFPLISIVILISILYLPSFIELRKPKDNGPRMLFQKTSHIYQYNMEFSLERTDNQVIGMLTKMLGVLPNLEL